MSSPLIVPRRETPAPPIILPGAGHVSRRTLQGVTHRPPAEADFVERLWLPWWAWPAGLAVAAVLVTEIAVGAPTLRHPLLYIGGLALAAAGLVGLCRIKIRVADGVLWVDDAHLEGEFIGSVSPLDPAAKRDLLGPNLDPLAFVIQRPWIRGSVRIDLADPADPTPYWVVSTRHPERLTTTLLAARAARPQTRRS